MIKTQLGLYEKALHDQLTLEQKVLLAKQAQFAFLELSIDESESRLARLDWSDQEWIKLKDFLDQHQFRFGSLCLSGHRKYPLGSSDPVVREHSVRMLEKALRICQILDIKIIQLAGYDVFYEPSTPETQAWFATNLKLIAQKAAAAGVYLGIETMDTPFLGTATRCRKYVDLVNSPYLQIYPDIGNLSQWTDRPEQDLSDNVQFFLQVHIKSTLPNVFRDLAWEAGNVEYVKLLKTLADQNYTGHFLAEMWAPKDEIFDYEKEMARLNHAYEFVADKLKQAGYQLC
ncbi:L-ribulose-5-phosphate 3-epimerase [Mycoplasmoides fastidiosum]|uniref:L-ribulose-5-phosphate 3-epimerase n=1 Tax=Mycoplasmoides fastidiosum TaxID=92758 RepID=A0ABU0LZG5_9BACT|nr:L-ribulose-5-phosphate 3-epimerase [Mycoplasmoides fastidiosum]MDQ0514102.1 L-ribulose-5-phosphate 3-epimerase [Mycoplasmoides fastidiosum]UUD37489.1 L-ribulose-5-phosphate 3-epimerase [Mycoplasmoides fastidiosum]